MQLYSRRQMTSRTRGIRMKIIITGCGKIGQSLAASLCAEGNDVTCIDTNQMLIEDLTETYDVMGICGNGADSTVLKEAGIDGTDLLVSVSGSDELNMLTCFLGRRMGAKNTIARIRNPEYNDESLNLLRQELELSVAINPEKLTAHEIYNVLKFPSAVNIEPFSRGLEMVEIRLKTDSVLDGMTLHKLRTHYTSKILVCCVRRGDNVYIPTGSFELKSNDVIGITGSPSEIHKFLKELNLLRRRAKDIMIIGGSRIARYLADMIISGGSNVTIIEKNRAVCEALSRDISEANIICADGTDHDVLLEEGIRSCDAFVTLTGFDEENILMSIFASSQSVPKVVTKINGESMLKMGTELGIDTPVCPHNAVSNVVLRYVRALRNSEGSSVETLYKLFDGAAEALEFRVDGEAPFTGTALKALKFKKNTMLAGIIRNRRIIIPGGDDCIMAGDRVIVISAGEPTGKLADIFEADR